MKTSYFAKYKFEDGVSIARKPPNWFKGSKYPELYPSWDMIVEYKKNGDKQAYTRAYYKQVLDKLNPDKVWADLKDNTLLCWEKSGEFCHRRLVAAWLNEKLGEKIEEVK